MIPMAPKVKTSETATGIGTVDRHHCPLKTGGLERGRTVLIRTRLVPTPNLGTRPKRMMRPKDTTERGRQLISAGRLKRPRIGQGDRTGTGSVSATVVSGMGSPSSSAAPFDPASLVIYLSTLGTTHTAVSGRGCTLNRASRSCFDRHRLKCFSRYFTIGSGGVNVPSLDSTDVGWASIRLHNASLVLRCYTRTVKSSCVWNRAMSCLPT